MRREGLVYQISIFGFFARPYANHFFLLSVLRLRSVSVHALFLSKKNFGWQCTYF